ncbi:MAG: diphosphomevalonate decarboxylase [Bacteroidetes bacterium]|nr:diphosphomevalonate decarboxylase [Bacteroidota bacterium]
MNQSTWQSPSNIALVKYWGKKGFQLPANPSISFTLDNCFTETTLIWDDSDPDKNLVSVYVEGIENPAFVPKAEKFFNKLIELHPLLKDFRFELQTYNTFPHSSGIASSASSMSALALCCCDMLMQMDLLEIEFYRYASFLARIGSGSACRSVYGDVAMWGEHEAFPGSSDDFAIPVNEVHPVFKTYRDTILIIHEGQKSVSSTVGHGLLKNHPFAQSRFEIANRNMHRIRKIMTRGDVPLFTELVEAEAMMLHALMMTSDPNFLLMKSGTVAAIHAIRESRAEHKHNICFTLDAGANVHMLYPEEDSVFADELLNHTLVGFCEKGRYIRDNIGRGPIRLNA